MTRTKGNLPSSHGVGRGSSIVPDRDGLVAVFWEGVQSRQLLLQRCLDCMHCQHPPFDLCEQCQSPRLVWKPSPGAGVLYSYTVVHHAVHPLVESWVPYTLCLIGLDEGPRILATVDPDEAKPLQIGSRVQLGFRAISECLTVPVFRIDAHPLRRHAACCPKD